MAIDNYTNLEPFRFWCQTVLPSVYDESLSYYELLCKVVHILNETTKDVTILHDFVDNYFTNLDVQEEINTKLDAMAADGSLGDLINEFVPDAVTAWLRKNIDPSTAPPVDKSLSVESAAADAQVTGNHIHRITPTIFSNSKTGMGVMLGGLKADGHFINQTDRAVTLFNQIKTGAFVKLNSSAYSIVSVWTYSGDPYGTVTPLRHVFVLNDRNSSNDEVVIPFEAGEEWFRVAFVKADSSDFTDEDLDALRDSLMIARRTDDTLEKVDVPADSKAVGDYTHVLRSITDVAVPVDRGRHYTLFSGGIDAQGASVSNTARARTNYLVLNGAMKFVLDSDDYVITSAWTYTGDLVNVSTFEARRNLISENDYTAFGNTLLVHSQGDETMVRLVFANKADMATAITSENRATISAALHTLYCSDPTLSIYNVPADSKTVGDTIANRAKLPVVHDTLPATATDLLTQWDELATNGLVSNDTSYSFIEAGDSYTIKSYKIVADNNWINTTPTYYDEFTIDPDSSKNPVNKPNILIVSGFHGNEKQTPWALQEFVIRLCTLPEYANIRGMFNWYFVPLLNPYGYNHDKRGCNASNLDPNRQFFDYLESVLSGESYIGNPVTMFAGDMAMARQYALIFDLHQDPNYPAGGSYEGLASGRHYRPWLCAYSSALNNVDADIVKAIQGSFAETEQKLNVMFNKPNTQTLYLSTSQNGASSVIVQHAGVSGSFRQFCQNKLALPPIEGSTDYRRMNSARADNVLLLETSTRSYFYSGSNTVHNATSLTVSNEVVNAFLKACIKAAPALPELNGSVYTNVDEQRLVPCPIVS